MTPLNITLEQNGTVRSFSDIDNDYYTLRMRMTGNSIEASLEAKQEFTLQAFTLTTEREFTENTLFFSNGWESWSTTREYGPKDIARGIHPFTHYTEDYVQYNGFSGDYAYTTYDVQGQFHSWSYTYLREKGSSEVEFYASRNERSGFTLFEVNFNDGTFTFGKDVEGQKCVPGETYSLLDVYTVKEEYTEAHRSFFQDEMQFAAPKVDRLAGYTSWYNYFQDISEEIMLRDLEGLKRAGEHARIFQIDDGFETKVGDWLSLKPEEFPNGLTPIVEEIHGTGSKAGLWLAPFCAETSSDLAKEHPSWMLRDEKSGKNLLCHFGWDGAYGLDIYNPEVRAYLKEVFDTVFDVWGFDMVKLDFLYSVCSQPRDGKTRGELMCDGVDLLRELCGDNLILGCGVPLGACWGVFDACRVGPDANKEFAEEVPNRIGWNREIPSSQYAMGNSIFRRGLDGLAFANDPDVFFLRDENQSYTREQQVLLALVNDIVGSIIFMSDNAGDYDEETVKLLKHIFQDKERKPVMAEFEEEDVILITYQDGEDVKNLVFNWKTGESNAMELVEV